MQRAVSDFLAAIGADPTDPALAHTPAWVTEAWADELLAGEGIDPGTILDTFEAPASEGAVMVTGIAFVGVCPHHLLPYLGRAHLAYLPADRIVGFSKLVRLVEALGARLALQETVTHAIADALMEHLGARGAMVVTEAKQACMALRGVRRHEATVRCTAARGRYAEETAGHRAEFLAAVGAWNEEPKP